MRRKSIMTLLYLTALMMLVFITGCGKQEGVVVAKIGDRQIIVEDIDRYFDRAGFRFVSIEAELNARRDYLDTLINQELLIIGAYEKNLENQEEVLKVVEGEKIKFLLDALYENKILSKARPSEAEIKDWYMRTSEEIKASHILVEGDSTAREVLDKLKEGAIFEELAAEYSIDPSVQRNQGDLGWFTWGLMVDNVQEAAFRMKAGEISAPVKSEFGYHIIKVVERRDVEHRPGYEESKVLIKNSIIERRKRTLMTEYAKKLKAQYPITIEKPTCEFVLNKLQYLYPDSIGGQARPRNNIDPAQIDQDEGALVLGRYEGGQLLLSDYLNNLRRVHPDRRPDFDQYDSLAEFVFQMQFMDILNLEAKAGGFENDKKYKKNLLKFKELAMADILRNDSIPYNADITEIDVKEYYATHPEEMTVPLRFHLFEIQVGDEETAVSFKKSINSFSSFKKIAAKETLRPGYKKTSGDLGIIFSNQYPALYNAAESLTRGNMAGPIANAGKFSLIWIKEQVEAELQPYESVRLTIIEILTREKGGVLFQEWVKDMKKRITIEVYEDVLAESVNEKKYAQADTVQSGG